MMKELSLTPLMTISLTLTIGILSLIHISEPTRR